MFQIQMGYPKIVQSETVTYKRVDEVFLELFREEEESFFILWRNIPLRFRYCKELANNFDSILAMVWLINREPQGGASVSLINQLLTIDFNITWYDMSVELEAVFSSRFPVYDKYVEILNKGNSISLEKSKYLAEWHTLIHQIVVSFAAGNISIEDGNERRKLEMLQGVDRQLIGYGSLYEAS